MLATPGITPLLVSLASVGACWLFPVLTSLVILYLALDMVNCLAQCKESILCAEDNCSAIYWVSEEKMVLFCFFPRRSIKWAYFSCESMLTTQSINRIRGLIMRAIILVTVAPILTDLRHTLFLLHVSTLPKGISIRIHSARLNTNNKIKL